MWLLGGTRPFGGGRAMQQRRPNAKEYAVLQVGLTDAGQCVLLENPPDPIRSHNTGGGKAEWIVVGNCDDDDMIAIDPVLTLGGTKHENVITPNGPMRINAKHEGRIRVTVRQGAQQGEYEYQVLINDQPAEYVSPADRGVLAVCPDWPCR